MLKGIEIKPLKKIGDERGFFTEIMRIPGHYRHGFKVVGDERAYLVYFVNRQYDYENLDEERSPWNDKTIIPKSINDRVDDPRVGKPWDWFYPSHK